MDGFDQQNYEGERKNIRPNKVNKNIKSTKKRIAELKKHINQQDEIQNQISLNIKDLKEQKLSKISNKKLNQNKEQKGKNYEAKTLSFNIIQKPI